MSTPILPLAVWASGTNQNSIPANDNALRIEALSREIISLAVTAQPGSPADGDTYIIAATHTGAMWAGFSPKDVAIYRGGTWYAWAPTEGVVVNVAGALYKYDGAAWVAATTGGMSNPMTTAQDIITGGASGAPARLAVGSNGQVLSVTSGAVGWATPSAGFVNPMTTAEDIIKGGASGAAARLAVGSNGQVLTVTGGAVGWATPSAGFSNPMTTTGDVIYSSSGSTPARLGVGSSGQVMTVAAGVPSWATPSSGFANPMTTIGDVIVGSTAGAAIRLANGTAGYVLTAQSGAPPAWAAASGGAVTQCLAIACSDEMTSLTTGNAKVTFRMPYSMTLTAVRASVTTAPTGSTMLIDINMTGSTILTTRISLDATEKTSVTAATPPVILTSALTDDAEMTIDLDQVGSTVPGTGLKVYLIGTVP